MFLKGIRYFLYFSSLSGYPMKSRILWRWYGSSKQDHTIFFNRYNISSA